MLPGFDERLKKRQEEFDRDWHSMRRTATIGMLVSAGVTLAVLIFLGWVIVALLLHFGVIG